MMLAHSLLLVLAIGLVNDPKDPNDASGGPSASSDEYSTWVMALGEADPAKAFASHRKLVESYPASRPAVLFGLRSSDDTVRAACLRVLEASRDAKNTRWMAGLAMSDASSRVRMTALHALENVAEEEALPILRKLLQHESDPTNLRTVLRKLTCRQDQECVGVLLQRMSTSMDEVFVARGFEALRHIAGLQLKNDFATWNAWWQAHRASRESREEVAVTTAR